MVRTRRSSSIGLVNAVEVGEPNTTTTGGNFSTRFSLPSFRRRVDKLSDSQKIAIERTGFGNLLQIPCHTLSKNLLQELMDRWCSEKLAFALVPRTGNIITPTLTDVALILGLRVTGDPVTLEEDEPFSDLEREYGAEVRNRKITISSIEERLDLISDTVSDEFVRSFLLFTFGTLLFPSANGKVDSRYLALLQELDKVQNFAWGAAVLEDIINWLCKRKEMNIQCIGGCLIFLQIWSYEHIDIARPNLLDCTTTIPRACRWEKVTSHRSHHRQWFSTKFKELKKDQITWKLQLTDDELKADIIKELLEAQSPNAVTYRFSQNQLRSASLKSSVGPAEYVDLTSPPHHLSEGERWQIEQSPPPSTSQGCSLSVVMISDDDADQTLLEKNAQLKKEIIELRRENKLLKDQLLSRSTSSKEEITKLRKEVDDLRQENQQLLLSSNGLVTRLQRLVLGEEVNADDEPNPCPSLNGFR